MSSRPSMNGWEEQRPAGHASALLGRAVTVEMGERQEDGVLEHISPESARLRLADGRPVRIGDTVKCRLDVPGLLEAVEIRGVVRWQLGFQREVLGIQFSNGLRARQCWALLQQSR